MRDTKQDVLYFWFEETQPAQWFQKNEDFDRIIRERFLITVEMARDGLCDHWTAQADGALALCITLDQFPRNIFRDSAKAFTSDEKALLVAKAAIARGFDQVLQPIRRRFLYLPFEHSENLEDQKKSVAFFAAMKDDDPMGYEYALRHLDIIERFGRFPHRNGVLGRESRADELCYLSQPDSGF